MDFGHIKIYSRNASTVTKSGSDNGIPGKNILKHYKHTQFCFSNSGVFVWKCSSHVTGLMMKDTARLDGTGSAPTSTGVVVQRDRPETADGRVTVNKVSDSDHRFCVYTTNVIQNMSYVMVKDIVLIE
ncbi:hypothetical protein EVAR_95261_1 [Eumeta japonica]|uniref:Uncharacterized protein n=1 Tax=Eumeta variegata TaxID=151549 RepID=A0A4C1UK99_EUMVA|nr:hypothetical protein EVAR_95261_1 [Eumeta japonica]